MELPAGEYEVRVEVVDQTHAVKTGRPMVLITYGDRLPASIKLIEEGGDSFILPEHAEKYGRCDVCNQVLGEILVKELGKKWCTSCFACLDCKKPLAGHGFYIKNGFPWCEQCKPTDATLCGNGRHGCGKAINSAYVIVLDAEWHPECFVCATCGSPLASLYVQGNRLLCSTECVRC